MDQFALEHIEPESLEELSIKLEKKKRKYRELIEKKVMLEEYKVRFFHIQMFSNVKPESNTILESKAWVLYLYAEISQLDDKITKNLEKQKKMCKDIEGKYFRERIEPFL